MSATSPAKPGYPASNGARDEGFEPGGVPRAPYERLIEALDGADLAALRDGVARDLEGQGVSFGSAGPFVVDPIPRILTAAEWQEVELGVAQRVRALNAFVDDVYSGQRIVEAGIVPSRVIEEAAYYEPALRGYGAPHGIWTHVCGLDLVRDREGRFLVLEDNVRTPSGITYATGARTALSRVLPGGVPSDVASLDPAWDHLRATLHAAAPEGVDEPLIALLSDGPENVAFYEHRTIAATLGIPLCGLEQLSVQSDRLVLDGVGPIDVVYRRTNADLLIENGSPTPVSALLERPMRAGTLGVVNAFGTGVADDKLTHAYVEDMVRFYLGEDPRLPSVPTYDLGDPDVLEQQLPRIHELVVKPREGLGGHGIVVCPHANADDVRAIADAVRMRPQGFIAQEMVVFSTHPTVVGDRLCPRHVDLRPFAYMARDTVNLVPGGLTRVALGEGALVVNSSQQGGAKDTWVIA